VSSASGPFRLYRWAMRKTDSIQHPRFAHEWPVGSEAPEGLCRQGQGLLVLYDVGDKPERIDGSRFRADWLTGV
jgi:hypothetical protein